jgi:hypothetical protein
VHEGRKNMKEQTWDCIASSPWKIIIRRYEVQNTLPLVTTIMERHNGGVGLGGEEAK